VYHKGFDQDNIQAPGQALSIYLPLILDSVQILYPRHVFKQSGSIIYIRLDLVLDAHGPVAWRVVLVV
jgi:hypothetical protein